MPIRIVAALLGLTLVLPCRADAPPRAERLQDWRARLERAAAHGDTDPAIDLYRSILDQAASLDEDGILVARATDGLADVYRSRRQFDLAAPLYERSTTLWKKLLGATQPRLAVTYHNLGVCYVELAEWNAAERVLREALRIWRAGGHAGQAAESEKALRAAREHRSIPWD